MKFIARLCLILALFSLTLSGCFRPDVPVVPLIQNSAPLPRAKDAIADATTPLEPSKTPQKSHPG